MPNITEIILFSIINIFCVCVKVRFIGLFFDRKKANKFAELLIFISYYIITCVLYFLNYHSIILISINIILLIVITLSYKGSVSLRILSAIVILSTALIVKTATHFCLYYYGDLTNVDATASIVGNILILLLVVVLENKIKPYGMKKNDIKYWIFTLLIPICSIIIVISLIKPDYESLQFQLIIVALFAMNITVFYLQDLTKKKYEIIQEIDSLKLQNKAYLDQFSLIEESQQNLQTIKHDMKNHLSSIKFMVEGNRINDAIAYLEDVSKTVGTAVDCVCSGNFEVDSILNYKIAEAHRLMTDVEVSVNIPSKIGIDPFDLNVVLGNLIDNSLEALKKCEDRRLQIVLKFDRSVLYITIANTYSGKLSKRGDKLLSTKFDHKLHGIGLENVRDIITKFNGEISFKHTKHEFFTNVLMYMKNLDDNLIDTIQQEPQS